MVESSAQGKIGRGTWEARLWSVDEAHGCHGEYITEGGPQPGIGGVRSSGEAGNDQCAFKFLRRWSEGTSLETSLGKRKGEPLGRTHYGKLGVGGRGKRRSAVGQTLFAETETTSEGEAGAEIPILRFI